MRSRHTNLTSGSSDNMTLVDIWWCHLISSLVFILLLCYLDNVRPGKYGVAQPWYFPLTVSHNSEENTVRPHSSSHYRDPTGAETIRSWPAGTTLS